MVLNTISALIVFCLVVQSVRSECKVSSQTYTTSDGIVIAKVAHIITFTAQCTHRAPDHLLLLSAIAPAPKHQGLLTLAIPNQYDLGLPLYADLNGQTLPVIRSDDSSNGQTYQISWTVELSKSSSASHSISIYDEEGFTSLRKANRAGAQDSSVAPLFALELSHSSPYKGPLIQTELVATLAALGLWWSAYIAKSKLTN